MSNIDVTVPIEGDPTTESVRDNFAVAASEVDAALAAGNQGIADAATKLPLAGGTLTGALSVEPSGGISEIKLKRRIASQDAGFIVHNENENRMGEIVLGANNNLIIRLYDNAGIELTKLELLKNGNVSINGAAPTAADQFTRKDYVDGLIPPLLARLDALENP